MQKKRLTWDTTAIIISIICWLVFLLIMVMGFLHKSGWEFWICIIIGAFGITLPALFCPYSITKKGDQIFVNHLLHKRHIDLSQYKINHFKEGYSLKGFWRTCASGGLMGYWGIWCDANGKNYNFYLTNRKRDVTLLVPNEGVKGRRILINLPASWIPA